MVIAVHLAHEVPIFSPTEAQIGHLRALLGDRAEVVACRSEPEFLAALPRAELAVVWTFRQEWLERCKISEATFYRRLREYRLAEQQKNAVKK